DLGGLSAWHVWSMLGLGPVTPGAPFFVVGSPAFAGATVRLAGGRKLEIRSPAASLVAKYVTGARLDGRPLDRAWVTAASLRRGAVLDLDMSATPDKTWGAAVASRPPSASDSPLDRFGCAAR